MLVAPTEPRAFDELGRRSLLPESYGVDFLFASRGQFYGVQRKEVKDFVASVHDGRLSKELGQMSRLGRAMLCVEGRWVWTKDGEWCERGRWSRQQHLGFLWSVRARGIWVESSADIAGTSEVVRGWEKWVRKEKHSSGLGRPGPKGLWGRADDKDWALHFMCGLPGVGPELASRVFDEFGRVPFTLDVTEGELCKVKGMGKKRAASIARVLAVPSTPAAPAGST